MSNYNKLWVSLIMVVAQIVNANTEFNLVGLDQNDISVIVSGLTAMLVYQVPNVKKK